jgi:hypothetical protein
MNRTWGIFLVVVLAALAYGAAKTYQAIGQIQYTIAGFGLPRLVENQLQLPVIVRFINPALIPVPINSLRIDLNYLRNGQPVKAGTVEQTNFSINPGTSEVPVNTTVDLRAITDNFWQSVASAAIGNLQIKADVLVTVAGQTSSQSLTKTVRL